MGSYRTATAGPKAIVYGPILVTGGCGFVGRHVVQHILRHGLSNDVWLVDDLSTGRHPEEWLPNDAAFRGASGRLYTYVTGGTEIHFAHADARQFFADSLKNSVSAQPKGFGAAIHLASIVGGRSVIDGDPLLVATDLSIDSEMFQWARTVQPERVLFASSSAAYPTHLQGANSVVRLKEGDISFDEHLGMPDMTYGWSKLTGEYLSRIAASRYGLRVSCVRPFSGYGEDQETVYPIPAIAERAARKENPLVVWGTGRQARDFVYIDDCVDVMFRAMEEIHDGSAINIGTGVLTTFLEVAKNFSSIAGYAPSIKPMVDKPTGVQNRCADVTMLKERFKWTARVPLMEGFERVLEFAKKRVASNERFRITYEERHCHHHN
ncbi:MAG TPA: NAD-dependent epimerase/dehydratase family protein [Candidatus Acidoferrales bacterium]